MSLFRPARLEARDVYGSPTYNPFENPAVPLQSVGFDNVFGMRGNDSGESVTVDKALGLPTLIRCIGLLSTVVASCPLKVYKEPQRKVVPFPLFQRGNQVMTYTQFELWELAMVHLLLWGNAYVLKVRNGADVIVDLKPINPSLVKVDIEKVTKEKIFLVRRINHDGSISQDKPQIFTTYEIMHVPGLGYDGLQGLSPIGMAGRTLGTSIAGDRLAARFYSKGSQLGGVLKIKAPLSDQTQADNIKKKWMQVHAGVGHAGDVAILDAETDFQPVTIPPEALQFLQSRRWQTTEIARLYGIPPHLVGDVEKSTSWGTGIEEQNSGFIAYTVSGWTCRIEQRAERELVQTRGQFAEFNLDRLLRGDTLERYQAYAIGVQWGWLTRNEARGNENLEPIDGLDEPLTPLNMKAGSTSTEAINPNVTPLGPASGDAPGSGAQQAAHENEV